MGIGQKLPDVGLWGAEAAALKMLGIDESKLLENPYKADYMPLNNAKHICWEMMLIHNELHKIKNK